MGIKRRILASAAVALGITQIYVASTRLTVELKAGDKYSFLLADKPVFTFSSGDLVVNGLLGLHLDVLICQTPN